MIRTPSVAAVIALLALGTARAQPAPPPQFRMVEAPAPAEPNAITLGPDTPTAGPGESWARMGDGQLIVRNVTRATLTPFLPPAGKATGAAVIVAPGGGFQMLAMTNEGWPVARWLADHGIAAFVLKYRLNPTEADILAFQARMDRVFADAMKGGTVPELKEPRATNDALTALRYVRVNAARFGVDPARVGMIGFSAGAMTTLQAVLTGDAITRPAFIGYIYGPMTAITVPHDAPPMFAALALDDGLFGHRGSGSSKRGKGPNRPIELHAYARGDHGFGMGRPGTTTTGVMPQFRAWLDAERLLARRKAK